MARIKYQSGNTKQGSIKELMIFVVPDDQVSDCIAAELETAKQNYIKNNIDYDHENLPDSSGKAYTHIWADDGSYTEWVEL